MTFIYTRSMLKAAINRHVQNKEGMLISFEDTCNETVRSVFNDVDLRTARRTASLSPNLFNGIFDYSCPTDLKSYSIIDVPQQAKRDDGEFFLVPSNEFELQKKVGMIAIDDYNGARVLKISSKVSDLTLLLSELDSLTSNGTWSAFGDASGLVADTDDYIKGNGSLKFSLSAAGGTTAGIVNTTLPVFDLTNYLNGNGAAFVWAKINSITGLTNYILRLGSSSSNYYQKTVTTQADGTAFVVGWNLLKFDLTSLTTVGTPVITAGTYANIYMTKLGSKISESDYKFDWLCLKDGKTANTKYYSKYGWQTAAGAYIENSTSDTDFLVCDTDEFDIIVRKGIYVAANELDLSSGGRNPLLKIEDLDKQYQSAVKGYQLKNPSEAKIMTSEYYVY